MQVAEFNSLFNHHDTYAHAFTLALGEGAGEYVLIEYEGAPSGPEWAAESFWCSNLGEVDHAAVVAAVVSPADAEQAYLLFEGQANRLSDRDIPPAVLAAATEHFDQGAFT